MVFQTIGLCYFLYLIGKDAVRAHQKMAHWIPGEALILSAFTIITAVLIVDITSVSVSDEPNLLEVLTLLANHLITDSGRLVMCVFMAYLVPGMALSSSGGAWSNISALAMIIFTGIASELYFLYKSKDLIHNIDNNTLDNGLESDVGSQLQKQPSLINWYVASSLGTVAYLLLLLLLLASVISTGNTIRGILSQRITAALPTEDMTDEFTEEVFKKEVFKEVFKSWLLARACRPEYVIARSVLSSAVGMLLTLRIVFSLLYYIFIDFKGIINYGNGPDPLWLINFILQCIFIYCGWFVICCRWITAVVCFSKPDKRRSVFVVEDFWLRHIKEKKYGWESYFADSLKEKKWNATFQQGIQRICISVIVCATGILLGLQYVVVLFGKICWFLSEIVIGCRFFRRCFLRICGLVDEYARGDSSEFDNYRDIFELVLMPEERAASLWVANEKFIKQTKDCINNGFVDSENLEQLIKLVAERCQSDDYINGRFINEPEFESLPIVKEYFPSLDKMRWTMTTISYFKIMVDIFPASERLGRAMDAFVQVRDFMDFLERQDFQGRSGLYVNQMSKVGDQEFQIVKNCVYSRKNNPRVEEPSEVIWEMLGEAKQFLKDKGLVEQDTAVELQDSKSLTKIAPAYSLYKVCKSVLDRNGAAHEQHRMEDLLDTIIASCVLQFKEQLIMCCRKWAINLEEDKIWETVYMAGKVKGVLERAQVWPNSIDPQPGESSAPVVPNIINEATDT